MAQSWLRRAGLDLGAVEVDQVRAGDQEQDGDRCEPGRGDDHLHAGLEGGQPDHPATASRVGWGVGGAAGAPADM